MNITLTQEQVDSILKQIKENELVSLELTCDVADPPGTFRGTVLPKGKVLGPMTRKEADSLMNYDYRFNGVFKIIEGK